MRSPLALLALAAACGDDPVATLDAALPDAAPAADATLHLPADAALRVRLRGHVDYHGPIAGAVATVLGGQATATTDDNGDFFFDVFDGSTVIVKVEAAGLFPMIRGVVARDGQRIRNYYLLGPSDVEAAGGLGLAFDAQRGIVEVDFRNAAIGGYGATLTAGGAAVTPGFGMVYDGDGEPRRGTTTLAGGDGSTLLLGDVSPGEVTFAPNVPGAAALPCQPRDVNPLPVQAGTVTWFDYECGDATD